MYHVLDHIKKNYEKIKSLGGTDKRNFFMFQTIFIIYLFCFTASPS